MYSIRNNKTILMPCAAVIVINDNNEVLLQKRVDNSLWAIHGGAIEPDESVEDAAKRELKEETGLEAIEIKFFKFYSGKDYHHIYPNKDEVSIIDFVFVCKKYKGELKCQKDEVKELKFFSLENLPSEMMLRNRQYILDYFNKNNKKA